MSVLTWGTVGLVLSYFVVNGLVMVISPRRWFELPRWLGMWGSLPKEISTTPASVGIRIAGGIFIAVAGFLAYELFSP